MMRLLAACAAVAFCAFVAAPAVASDRFVKMTLDGRLVDRVGGNAILRANVVFADMVDVTKTFNGLYSFQNGGGAIITIGGKTGTFRPGTWYASIDGESIKMPGRPFVRDGEMYVPLAFFITHMTDASVKFNAAQTRADIRADADPLK